MTSISITLAGGGWPQPEKGYFLKLSQWWVVYDDYYNQFGNKVEDRTRGLYKTSLYAEYGFSNNLTGILYFPFISRAVLGQEIAQGSGQVLAEGDVLTTVGDPNLQLKYGLLTDTKVVLSGSLLLGIPFGRAEGGRDGSLWTGDGEFNQMLILESSTSFKVSTFYPYVSIYTAYNNRGNNFANEIRAGLSLGSELNNFQIKFRMDIVTPLGQNNETTENFNTGVNLNNTEYLSTSAEVGYNITKGLGIGVSYNKNLSGKLIFSDPSYTVGVFLTNN